MYGLNGLEQFAIWSVLVVAILGLLYALFLRSQILKEDKGTPEMQEVWGAISVIIAPVVVTYRELGIWGWTSVAVLLALLVWAVMNSKRPVQGLD